MAVYVKAGLVKPRLHYSKWQLLEFRRHRCLAGGAVTTHLDNREDGGVLSCSERGGQETAVTDRRLDG